MVKDIEPGYLLKITTLENDGDNYNTKEISGLSKSDAQFYLSMASLFYSDGTNKPHQYGNADIVSGDYQRSGYRKNDEDLVQDIKDRVDQHKSAGYSVPSDWDYSSSDDDEALLDDKYSDLCYGLIGIWNEGENWRVFDSYQVYLVPQLGIENVTSTFEKIMNEH